MASNHLPTDDVLQAYRTVIGRDFDRYANHVRRVFLNCLLLDKDPEHEKKYAIAAVFHDLGIWTDHTFDYLQPSIEQATQYLKQINRPEWKEEIALMIDMHHKVSPYRGSYAVTVEVFRRADWIDVTFGIKRFGIDIKALKINRKTYPNLGFHGFLLRSTIKHILKHPLKNPLPMFRS